MLVVSKNQTEIRNINIFVLSCLTEKNNYPNRPVIFICYRGLRFWIQTKQEIWRSRKYWNLFKVWKYRRVWIITLTLDKHSRASNKWLYFSGLVRNMPYKLIRGRITISNSNDQHKLSLYILRIRIWVKYWNKPPDVFF